MKYELAHDSIARQVFEKASSEAKLRRKVEQYIEDRYDLYLSRQYLLSKDDMEYIHPFLEQISLVPEKEQFIYQSKRALSRKRRFVQLLTASIITILTLFSAIAYYNWQKAEGSALFKAGELEAQSASTDGIRKMRLGWQKNPEASYMKSMQQVYRENSFEAARYIFGKGGLNQVAFSSDGNYTASIHKKSTLVFLHQWKDDNYQLVDSLSGFGNTNSSLRFSPDDRHLLIGSSDRRAHLWTLGLENKVVKFPKERKNKNGQVLDITFLDSNSILNAHQRSLYWWHITDNNKPIHRWKFSEELNQIVLAKNRQQAFIGFKNGRLQQLALHRDSSAHILHRYAQRIRSLALSPDEKHLAVASSDSIFLWQYDSLKQQFRPKATAFLHHQKTINVVQFSPDGHYLISASDDQNAVLWEVQSGRLLRRLKGHNAPVHSVAFAKNGASIYTASADSTIRKWEWIHDLALYETAFEGSIKDVAIPSKNELWFRNDDGIWNWKLASNQQKYYSIEEAPFLAFKSNPSEAATRSNLQFSDHSDYVLTIEKEKAILWKLQDKNHTIIQTIKFDKGTYNRACFIAQNKQAAIFDLTGKQLEIYTFPETVFDLVFDTKNKHYITLTTDGLVSVRDLFSNTLIKAFSLPSFKQSEGHLGLEAVHYSSIHDALITIGAQRIRLWSLKRLEFETVF